MAVTKDIRYANAFMAILSKDGMNNKEQFDAVLKECKIAEAMDKPMYAIVEKGAKLGILKDIPWQKVIHFTSKSDIQSIMTFIDMEVRNDFYT